MRIISKYHDYYDTALAFGHDDKVTFVREMQEYQDEKIPDEYDIMWKASGGYNSITFHDIKSRFIQDVIITPHTIAFCGKIYRGIIVSTIHRSGLWTPTKHEFFYDAGSLAEALGKKKVVLRDKEPVRHTRKPSGWNSEEAKIDRRLISLRYVVGVDEYFKNSVTDRYRDFFIEKKVAIAAWHPRIRDFLSCPFGAYSNDSALIINPDLSKFQFYKVFDPYQAFQELDMFLGGVMAGEDNPMAGISDEDLARAKGYDCMSFRKEPTKRKRKSCKK